jgi:CRISPR system Cascade subunit CasA
MVLTNGLRLDPQNLQGLEPMSGWRRSAAQQKKLGMPLVYMPSTHQTDRALWRGLSSLLPTSMADTLDGADFIRPGVIAWLGMMADDDLLGPDMALRVHAIGAVYGTQNATIADVVDDSLTVHAFLLSDNGQYLVTVAQDCVADTDKAVFALSVLAANLSLACGADLASPAGRQLRDGLQHATGAQAYAALDFPFRTWLNDLSEDTDDAEAMRDWHQTATKILRQLAQDLIVATGPAAFVGHRDHLGRWLTAGKCEQIFLRGLYTALPVTTTHDDGNTSEGSAS